MTTPHNPTGMGLGVGLLGIRERIRQLDGKLEILSGEGKGTLVTATIPHRPKKEPEQPRPLSMDTSAIT